MIIGDNFVFIHVPKCAGSSFVKMFKERHGLQEWGDPHSTAQDIPKEDWDKFIFGFMREPVKQEASNFRYHVSSWGQNFHNDMPFEAWCEWKYGGEHGMHWPARWIKRADHRQYGWDFSARPQAGFFCNEDGKCVADHIGRFSDLSSETRWLSEKLGLDLTLDEYHMLSTQESKVPYPTITDRCVQLLEEAKPIDFELYNAEGSISTTYTCPVVPDYAYARP